MINMDVETRPQRVAIVGGGIMGVTLAYKLSQRDDLSITIYERGDNLGGLAGYIPYDGRRIDRFYHTILSSDLSMQELIKEAGVEDRLHFTETKQGFYDDGEIHDFNTPFELMNYKPLNVFQRVRLGLQIVVAQFEDDWRKMDDIPIEDWLLRISGPVVTEKVWKPLLRAKFDTASTDVPATYLWSRFKRMMGTRQGVTSKEMMCYLENGYYTLIEGLAEICEKNGVEIFLNTSVEEIVIEGERAIGVKIDGETQPYDYVISTLQSPIMGQLVPNAPESFRRQLLDQEYLGVLCPLLILDRHLIPYYVLNITDASIPFTGVIETSNLIDPKHTKGHYLVYLPKYLAPDNEMAQWPDDKVKTEWLKHLKRMFPDFDENWITDFIVQRARYVEPIRPRSTSHEIPPIKTPVEGLFMGNTVMIYPDLSNGEAVVNFSKKLLAEFEAELNIAKNKPAQVLTQALAEES